jgi:hypothetical protein
VSEPGAGRTALIEILRVADESSQVMVSSDTIVNDHASADGGGIYENDSGDDSSFLAISGTALFANRAGGHGGGLFNREAGTQLSDSAITANHAGGGGGGIYDDTAFGAGDASVVLTGTPVTRNRPDNCEPAGSVSGCSG